MILRSRLTSSDRERRPGSQSNEWSHADGDGAPSFLAVCLGPPPTAEVRRSRSRTWIYCVPNPVYPALPCTRALLWLSRLYPNPCPMILLLCSIRISPYSNVDVNLPGSQILHTLVCRIFRDKCDPDDPQDFGLSRSPVALVRRRDVALVLLKVRSMMRVPWRLLDSPGGLMCSPSCWVL